MKRNYGKLFLGLAILGALTFTGAQKAHAASCTVDADCVFEGWYEDLGACKGNAYAAGYAYFDTGNSTNCSDGNACISCYFCPSSSKTGTAHPSSAPEKPATDAPQATQAR